MEDFTFPGYPGEPLPRSPGDHVPECPGAKVLVPESQKLFRNPGDKRSGIPEDKISYSEFRRQESRRTVFRNPGGSKLRSVPESGIPESVPESRKSLIFDLFVGCYRRAGGMKISTVVSTLFRGLPRLSEVIYNSYCSGILEQFMLLRDSGALEKSLLLSRAVS